MHRQFVQPFFFFYILLFRFPVINRHIWRLSGVTCITCISWTHSRNLVPPIKTSSITINCNRWVLINFDFVFLRFRFSLCLLGNIPNIFFFLLWFFHSKIKHLKRKFETKKKTEFYPDDFPFFSPQKKKIKNKCCRLFCSQNWNSQEATMWRYVGKSARPNVFVD